MVIASVSFLGFGIQMLSGVSQPGVKQRTARTFLLGKTIESLPESPSADVKVMILVKGHNDDILAC